MRSEKMKEKPILTIDAKYLGMKFDELIKNYPYLNKFLISSRPPKSDLGDPLTLSELNKCLFKELAGLNITVPEGYLIPAYSLRMIICVNISKLKLGQERDIYVCRLTKIDFNYKKNFLPIFTHKFFDSHELN